MTYLFLAVPPYSGSTVLHNYIAKCTNVTPLTNEMLQALGINENGIVEGNAATEARTLYADVDGLSIRTIPGIFISAIQNTVNYDWNGIKGFLDVNWEKTNVDASVRLQKTPNDTYRVKMMQPYFDAKWIIMVRDPYAWVESTIEKLLKRGENPSNLAEAIATHVVNTYTIQNENKEFLGDKAYVMTFEDFVANENTHTEGLKAWMPELSDLTFKGQCLVKQSTVQGLVNNNAQRLELLKTIPGAMDKFTTLFRPHEAVINSWGYELI